MKKHGLASGDHSHTADAIRARISQGARAGYLQDFVYGGIDGAVTTFAIAAGAWGAQLATRTVIILGVANLLADGLSMAIGNFLGTKAERENLARLRAIEERHVREHPEGEKEEIRQIFAAKGIPEPALGEVVKTIVSDPKRWVDTMLVEEYGASLATRSPWAASGATFLAFLICGAVPIAAFVLGKKNPFSAAAWSTSVVFILIGAAKSAWSPRSWWRSAVETLAVGSLAAGAAFLVGAFLRDM
jgi:VIT1/CCC1 family predicted Fe2+/Mn2+ transporter